MNVFETVNLYYLIALFRYDYRFPNISQHYDNNGAGQTEKMARGMEVQLKLQMFDSLTLSASSASFGRCKWPEAPLRLMKPQRCV